MRKFIILAVCAITPCFLHAKSQISITARTYLDPKIAFDEDALKKTMGVDLSMAVLNNLSSLLFGVPDNTQSITAAALTMVPKKGGIIFVDGNPKASTSRSDSHVIVSAGTHNIRVCYPYDDNGYYEVCGEEDAYVGHDASASVIVDANKLYITKKGQKAKEEAEAREAEARRQREIRAAEERRLEEIRRAEAQRLEGLRIAEEKRQRELWEAKTKREGVNQAFESYQDKFVRDDNLDVVVDPQANLMWQDSEATIAPTTWGNTKKYCDDLQHGGFSDWRLPSISELSNIIDDDKFKPALNNAFRYFSKNNTWYWSATTNSKNSSSAWYVNFQDGGTYWGDMTSENSVRCVRNIK